MPIQKSPDGHYIEAWRDAVAKGRARKRARQPKRDILMVKSALASLKLRYCQEVSFWNVHHKGKHGDLNGGLQWIDFVVRPKGKRPFAIILDDPSKRWKSYEKDAYLIKQHGLHERGTQYLILPAHRTSQEYQVSIYMFMRRNKI